MVDVVVVLVPFAFGPPGGTGTARPVVGDEKKTRNGGDGRGCLDEIDGCVSVDFESLMSSQFYN